MPEKIQDEKDRELKRLRELSRRQIDELFRQSEKLLSEIKSERENPDDERDREIRALRYQLGIEETEADFIFLRLSDAEWRVKFKDEGPKTIPPRKGFDYIRELLRRPREEIGVGKLVKTEVPEANHGEDDDLATSSETLRALADQKRSAVSRAIDRALSALKDHGMTKLASHLDATIEKGFTPRYNPEIPVPWKLDQ